MIPMLVLLAGADIKLAGSLSLAVSLPTKPVAVTRNSRDQGFSVVGRNIRFGPVMAVGAVVATFIGGRLPGVVPSGYLLPALPVILLVSAAKVWRHRSSLIPWFDASCTSAASSWLAEIARPDLRMACGICTCRHRE